MTDEATKPNKPEVKAVTKTGWKGHAVHEGITLPSGALVDIRIPNLPALVRAGQLPNHLVEVAAGVQSGTVKITAELFQQQEEFTNKLVALTVVNPKLTEEEVEEVVPYEDQEHIVRLATRQDDLDALGRHIGGLHKQEDFRNFRQFGVGASGFEGI